MTGLAISLVIYELPEVLGTHGGGGHGGAEGGDEHHGGINGWTLLVGLVHDRRVRRRAQALAHAAVEADRPRGGHRGRVRDHRPDRTATSARACRSWAGSRCPTRCFPLLSADGIALALRFGYDLLITAARDRRRRIARQPAGGGRRGGRPARHRAPSQPPAGGAGLRQLRVVALRRRAASRTRRTTRCTAHHGGGRKLVSSVATTTTLVLLLLYGAPLLQLIPVAALSGDDAGDRRRPHRPLGGLDDRPRAPRPVRQRAHRQHRAGRAGRRRDDRLRAGRGRDHRAHPVDGPLPRGDEPVADPVRAHRVPRAARAASIRPSRRACCASRATGSR